MHVYCAVNQVNGKIYVGQTNNTDLQKYWQNKIWSSKAHAHLPLFRAFKKHGADSFKVVSLANPIDKEQMDKLEKFFIRTLESQKDEIGYNLTAGGEGTWGYIPSQETRAKRSRSLTGRTFSEESKAKMKKARLGWKPSQLAIERSLASRKQNPHHVSDETKRKLSLSAQNRLNESQKKEIFVLRNQGKTLRDIGNIFSRSTGAISLILNKGTETYE